MTSDKDATKSEAGQGSDVWPPAIRPPFKTFSFDKGIDVTEYPDVLEVFCGRLAPNPVLLLVPAVSMISQLVRETSRTMRTTGLALFPSLRANWEMAAVNLGMIVMLVLLTIGVRAQQTGPRSLWRFRFEREGRVLVNRGVSRPLARYIYAEARGRLSDVVLDDPAGKAEKRIRGFTSFAKAEHAARYIQAFLAGVTLYE